ncbi:hypothetical protein RZS08_61485, partial [Arthrospira platensis SPKY1]|nr:hypothetical protein [Arthrospira platensis SPKY1]
MAAAVTEQDDFADDFEATTLGTHWGLYAAGSSTVRLTDSSGPRSGSQHLLFEQYGNDDQSAQLRVDLTGLEERDDLWLGFWVKTIGGNVSINQSYVELSADGLS